VSNLCALKELPDINLGACPDPKHRAPRAPPCLTTLPVAPFLSTKWAGFGIFLAI